MAAHTSSSHGSPPVDLDLKNRVLFAYVVTRGPGRLVCLWDALLAVSTFFQVDFLSTFHGGCSLARWPHFEHDRIFSLAPLHFQGAIVLFDPPRRCRTVSSGSPTGLPWCL